MGSEKDCLNEATRAEDILLGALGFDCEAKIIDVELTPEGYRGHARWSDEEEVFDFESDVEADELEIWAVNILNQGKGTTSS